MLLLLLQHPSGPLVNIHGNQDNLTLSRYKSHSFSLTLYEQQFFLTYIVLFKTVSFIGVKTMQLDKKKAIFGWAMYDWANSAFATTIIAGFFPVFFKQYWSTGVDVNVSTARLGLANSIAGIAVAVLAPILGAIADKGTTKKKFLLFFACMGVIMTSSLYLVSQGNWPLAIMLYVSASLGFSGGNVFYDALITGVASEKKMDSVSALGYSLGYLGGGLLFALNVWMTLKPQTFGFASASEAVRFSLISVGTFLSPNFSIRKGT
jgi:UMF1 family MFS transporter